MEETVKERISKYTQSKGMSIRAFERKANLSNGFVKNISKGIGVEKLRSILEAFPDINSDWLLYGTGEMLKAASKSANKELPLLPLDAMAGALSGVDFQIKDYECEHYVIPDFKEADFLISVAGDSMNPTFMSGDVLAVRKVPMGGIWFEWGRAYVIATRQGCIVKRILPSDKEGYVRIVSDNKDNYPPFLLPHEEINGVAVVLGIIRRL